MNLRDALQVFSAEDSAVDKQDALETQKTTDGNVGSTDTGTQSVVDAVSSVNEVKDVIDGVDTIEQGLSAANEVDAAGDAVLEHADAVKPVLDSGVEPAEVNKAVEHVADIAASIGDTPQHESYRLGLVSVEHSVDGIAYGQLAHEGMLQYGKKLHDTVVDALTGAIVSSIKLVREYKAKKNGEYLDLTHIRKELSEYDENIVLDAATIKADLQKWDNGMIIAYHTLYGTNTPMSMLKQSLNISAVANTIDAVCKTIDTLVAIPKETLGDSATLEKIQTAAAGLFKGVAVNDTTLAKLIGNSGTTVNGVRIVRSVTPKGLYIGTIAPAANDTGTFKGITSTMHPYALTNDDVSTAIKFVTSVKDAVTSGNEISNMKSEVDKYLAALITEGNKLDASISKLKAYISTLSGSEYANGKASIKYVRDIARIIGTGCIPAALKDFVYVVGTVEDIFIAYAGVADDASKKTSTTETK